MDEQDLKQALEHDAARRGGVAMQDPEFLKKAAGYLESAQFAAKAAAAGLMCKEPALREARQIARMAIENLEHALVLMSLEAPFDV